jgi:hypothetical protein
VGDFLERVDWSAVRATVGATSGAGAPTVAIGLAASAVAPVGLFQTEVVCHDTGTPRAPGKTAHVVGIVQRRGGLTIGGERCFRHDRRLAGERELCRIVAGVRGTVSDQRLGARRSDTRIASAGGDHGSRPN